MKLKKVSALKVRISLVFVLIFFCAEVKAQKLFYQDCFRGNVCVVGVPSWDSAVVQLYNQGSVNVKKAFLVSGGQNDNLLQGMDYSQDIYINGTQFTLNSFTRKTPRFDAPYLLYGGYVHVIDVSSAVNSSTIHYYAEPTAFTFPPGENPNPRFYGMALIVIYENPLKDPMCLSIWLNDLPVVVNNFYNYSGILPIDTGNSVGLSFSVGHFVGGVDGSYVSVNNNNIGLIKGPDECFEFVYQITPGALVGQFYYENGILNGICDDTPDSLMNDSDLLADIKSFLSYGATGFTANLKHELPNASLEVGSSNPCWATFLAYTSPCDTFTATLTSDTGVCAGAALQLNATGGANTLNQPPYEWSPQIGLSCYDCPDPVFSFPHDTVINYSVRIRNNDSCSKVLPLRILVKPKPHITALNITKPACGSADGQIHITGVSGDQPPYQYTLNGQTQPDGLFTGLASGTYPLTITGADGCAFDTVITLPDTLLVNAQFTADPQEGTAPLTVQFANQSTNATNYLWLINGETFTAENITYTFQQSGNYNAVLVSYNNTPACADTFAVDIFVYDELSVIVPNIFTPNADGVNDVFGVKVNVGCTVQAFIYNRWGTEVENITKEIAGAGFVELWNGHNHTDGVYFYVIKAKPNFGEEQLLKGNVTLVK